MVFVRSLLKKALSGNGEVTEMELIKLTQEECLLSFVRFLLNIKVEIKCSLTCFSFVMKDMYYFCEQGKGLTSFLFISLSKQ